MATLAVAAEAFDTASVVGAMVTFSIVVCGSPLAADECDHSPGRISEDEDNRTSNCWKCLLTTKSKPCTALAGNNAFVVEMYCTHAQ